MASIIDKFKEGYSLKKSGLKKASIPTADNGKSYTRNIDTLIMMNNGINICSKACAVCWDTPLPESYEERAKYIGKRTRIGHTSVIEHSNVVFYMEINAIRREEVLELTEFLSNVRYCHTKLHISRDTDILYLIIGGSWRAFADLYKVQNNIESNIMRRITNLIYQYIPSDGMLDLVEAGVLDRSLFADQQYSDITKACNVYRDNAIVSVDEKLDIINCDDINVLIENVKTVCPEPELFTYAELLDFCTITVNFKGMSRIITQQLTRHRNGITQESQRYVNYDKSCFNSPAKFKDKYDKNHTYRIKFGNSVHSMNLQELGDNITKIYGQLIDKSDPREKDHALQLEDARGYLPNNVQCGKIYITFTWRNFFTFLSLREDSHAQAELREFGISLGEWFRNTFPDYKDLYDALIPLPVNYSHYNTSIVSGENINTLKVEEDMGISEEVIINRYEEHVENITEEDNKDEY